MTTEHFHDELLTDFLDEAVLLLDRLNEDLLVLDESVNAGEPRLSPGCDPTLINNMFRSAHSIKGLSAMLGLGNINQLTHRVENILDAARKAELSLDRQVVQVIFEAIDHLSAMVLNLRNEGHDEHDASQVVDAIQVLLNNAGCEKHVAGQVDAEQALAALAAASPNNTLRIMEIEVKELAMNLPTAAVNHFAGIVDESEVPAKYLAIFIDETELSLDSLSETLVGIEQIERQQAIEDLLITSHRIKGSAASVGLHRPAKLAHLMEDMLQERRETNGHITTEMADAMLHCTDALRAYVAGLKVGSPTSERFSELADKLLSAHRNAYEPESVATNPSPSAADDLGSPAPSAMEVLHDLAQRHATQSPLLVGRVRFVTGLALAGLKTRLIYEKLCHLGEILECTPPMEGCDELETLTELTFALTTSATIAAVKARIFVAGVAELEVFEGPSLHSAPATAQPAAVASPAIVLSPPPAAAPLAVESPLQPETEVSEAVTAKTKSLGDLTNKPNETLRVDIERLDQLMNLAGQLVISKARFAQIGEGLKETMAGKQTPQILNQVTNLSRKLLDETDRVQREGKSLNELESVRSHARRLHAGLEVLQRELSRLPQQRGRVNELFEAVHQLDRVADGIQKSVMDTRMVPIGPLFGRFKRVVRDITRLNGKDVALVIHGEKTELDKRMIDELGDPLIHMVRNAADHGIESPEARVAAGKPAQGTLTLNAFHRGNSIIIQVSDDGKGLDKDRILAKAVEKQILTAADAEKMTPQQAYQLIWEPGFSTAERITEISGRGMGMDIVRSKIEEISGTVEVDSQPGQGTTFTIRLPLTLAILPSLMVEVCGDVFALPVESIVEIVSVPQESLKTVHGIKTAVIRGRVVSMVDLSELFTWNGPASESPQGDDSETTLVVLGQEGAEMGLKVDTLLGEEDVVIKSMAENYRNVPGIAGASILGDGSVSLILDVAALISMSTRLCRQLPVATF